MNSATPPDASWVTSHFSWPVRVYWEDTDAGGVVYYANYLKFFERARTEWLRASGIHQQAMRTQTGGMFVVSEAHVRYLKSAHLDDELVVTCTLIEQGRASITIGQQALITSGDDAVLLSEARIRAGWVNALGKPARIPQDIQNKLI